MKVRLKELGTISTGNTPSKKVDEYWSNKDIKFIKPDVIKDELCVISSANEYISASAKNVSRIVPANSILVTCIGEIGRVGITEEEVSFNQQINAIVPNEAIIPKYLAYAIYANRKQLKAIANAPVVPIINKTQFSDFEISIFESVEKQNKIVRTLDVISDIITNDKKKIEALDNLIKARFVEMFGDVYKTPKYPKQKWNEVVTIKNGKDYKKVAVKDGGYPVYGTGGEMARVREFLCPENTIIVGRKGTINNPLLVREKFWNVDTAFGVIPGVKLHYLYFFWFCKMFDFSRLNRQAVLPSTTKADLLNIEIQVPPIEVQNQFATFVVQVDKSKFALVKSIKLLKKLPFDMLLGLL